MKKGLTIQLVTETSSCLHEASECDHAQQVGFSFICRHPDHTQFHAHLDGSLTRNEALQRYVTLKQNRRNAFVAGLNESCRRFFCHRTDFHCRPLPERDMKA